MQVYIHTGRHIHITQCHMSHRIEQTHGGIFVCQLNKDSPPPSYVYMCVRLQVCIYFLGGCSHVRRKKQKEKKYYIGTTKDENKWVFKSSFCTLLAELMSSYLAVQQRPTASVVFSIHTNCLPYTKANQFYRSNESRYLFQIGPRSW